MSPPKGQGSPEAGHTCSYHSDLQEPTKEGGGGCGGEERERGEC